jgi:serine/threonine protein kinase
MQLNHYDRNSEKKDPYHSLRFLGKGSYGVVDEVQSSINGSVYARKTFFLTTRHPEREMLIEKIKQEARITHQLQHRHIAKVIETYQWRQNFGIIILPVADTDLSILLDSLDSLEDQDYNRVDTLDKMVGWCGCIIDALAYVHRNMVRHKDIKPSNILIRGQNIFLTDFGLALDMKDEASSGTASTDGLGNRLYRAPEVAKDSTRRGRSAGIFSLGCILLEVATVLGCETGSRTRFKEHRKNPINNTTCYSDCPEAILQWILFIWSTTNISGEDARNDHGESASVLAQLAFLLLDPDPSGRLSSTDLVSLLQLPSHSYQATIQSKACKDCKTLKGLDDVESFALAPSFNQEAINSALKIPAADVLSAELGDWSATKKIWLNSTELGCYKC